MKTGIRRAFNYFGFEIKKIEKKIVKPIDTDQIEVLDNPAFQASIRECSSYTLLDTARLANLWQLVRITDPRGAIIEVGSYRGGGGLHLSNADPDRKIWICESFKSFKTVDSSMDQLFDQTMFWDTSTELIHSLFRDKERNYEIIEGYFPESCQSIDLGPISFVHLDVDVYEAIKNSLTHITSKLLPHSLIVLDDYKRNAKGLEKAVSEFLATSPDWMVLPLFPGQGLMISRRFFEASNEIVHRKK